MKTTWESTMWQIPFTSVPTLSWCVYCTAVARKGKLHFPDCLVAGVSEHGLGFTDQRHSQRNEFSTEPGGEPASDRSGIHSSNTGITVVTGASHSSGDSLISDHSSGRVILELVTSPVLDCRLVQDNGFLIPKHFDCGRDGACTSSI